MATNRPSRYEAPYTWDGSQSSTDALLGWVRDAVNEGEQFLKGQTGYRFVDASNRIMLDLLDDGMPPTLSKASNNFIKRDVRELVGMLSNPRPLTSFKCDNPAYDEQAAILNRLYMAWYNQNFVDRAIKAALQYAAVEGTGYLMMDWDPGYWTPSKGEVTLTPLGVDQVLPIQISPEGWDLQTAYAVVIRRQLPVTHVALRYPLAKDRLRPDGDGISRFRRLANNLRDRVQATVHNTYGQQRGYKNEDPLSRALVTVYDIYILDPQLNSTGQDVTMGVPGSQWEYKVPSLGSQIRLPYSDPITGQPLSRTATPFDARLYPFHRHIVCTSNTILSDGPSRWWHGQKPLTKFVLDAWPQEYCGIPLTKEPAKLQAALTSLLRAYDDSANARLRPPVMYDGSRVNPALANSFDPRVGGQVFEQSNMMTEAFKLAVDSRYYQMQADIIPFMEQLRAWGSDAIGLPDLKNLSEAQQIPSGDSIEKMSEVAGPIATDLSRSMEASLRHMGEMFKCNVFEFYSARRRFQLLGPDGLTREDFDFDPGELVPLDTDLPVTGLNATRAERARHHMHNFQFDIVPNSVYQITQSNRRLMNLQLAKMGLPISPYTVLESCDIPNVGRPPAGPDGKQPTTEIDKFWAWKKEEAQRMIEIQMELTQAQMAMGMMQQAATPLGQLSGAIQQAVQAPTAQQQGPGRPNTFNEPPKIEEKDGGTRSTVTTS